MLEHRGTEQNLHLHFLFVNMKGTAVEVMDLFFFYFVGSFFIGFHFIFCLLFYVNFNIFSFHFVFTYPRSTKVHLFK